MAEHAKRRLAGKPGLPCLACWLVGWLGCWIVRWLRAWVATHPPSFQSKFRHRAADMNSQVTRKSLLLLTSNKRTGKTRLSWNKTRRRRRSRRRNDQQCGPSSHRATLAWMFKLLLAKPENARTAPPGCLAGPDRDEQRRIRQPEALRVLAGGGARLTVKEWWFGNCHHGCMTKRMVDPIWMMTLLKWWLYES